jgi:hypothetical protein
MFLVLKRWQDGKVQLRMVVPFEQGGRKEGGGGDGCWTQSNGLDGQHLIPSDPARAQIDLEPNHTPPEFPKNLVRLSNRFCGAPP